MSDEEFEDEDDERSFPSWQFGSHVAYMEIQRAKHEARIEKLDELGAPPIIRIAARLARFKIIVDIAACSSLRLPSQPNWFSHYGPIELIILSGRWWELQDPSAMRLRENWDLLMQWLRKPYPCLDTDVARIDEALNEPTTGVVSWLSKHT